jgi:hypothetical protein
LSLIESFGAKLMVPELLAVEEAPVSDGEGDCAMIARTRNERETRNRSGRRRKV